MADRATLPELIEFANQIREAGGGNPLFALMPAVPQDASQCLIAKNLNFNCRVSGYQGRWAMWTDEATADRIADAMGLERVYVLTEHGVILPEAIGQVATDFDRVAQVAADVAAEADWTYHDERNEWPTNTKGMDSFYRAALEELSATNRQMVAELMPYVMYASAEARAVASLINPDGSIVV